VLSGNHNFVIEQGATFSLTMTWKIDRNPVNLEGYTARLKAKPNVNRLAVIHWSTESGNIVLGGEPGKITLQMSAAETETLKAGKYVYDLELVSGEYVTRLLKGEITVLVNVTA
jgi:hypothetical protein